MDEDIAQKAIAKALGLGASYAEARLMEWEDSSLVMKNGLLEATGVDRGQGIGIRVLAAGNAGFAATNRLEEGNIARIVEEAVRAAKRASAKLGAGLRFSDEKPAKAKCKVKPKKDPRNVDFEQKVAALKAIDSAALEGKAGKSNVPARFMSYGDAIVRKHYENSEGATISSEMPLTEFWYSLTVVDGGESMQHHRSYAATAGFEAMAGWELEENARQQVASMLRTMREGVTPPRGPIDVVLSPELVGIAVHESCGHPHEADRILGREAAQAGESWLKKGMLGRKVGSVEASIVDDPTIAGSAGYFLYDDEGVKARRKTLMERGHVKGFLHNRETAAQLGTTSNASARASGYDKEPLVRMSNTFLLPGDRKSTEELFEGIALGIFINTFMEWNIDDRRWNQKYVGNEAYLIENGRLTRPVKKPALEITTEALWSGLDARTNSIELYAGSCGKGEPMQGIPVTMGGPHARFRNITLGK